MNLYITSGHVNGCCRETSQQAYNRAMESFDVVQQELSSLFAFTVQTFRRDNINRYRWMLNALFSFSARSWLRIKGQFPTHWSMYVQCFINASIDVWYRCQMCILVIPVQPFLCSESWKCLLCGGSWLYRILELLHFAIALRMRALHHHNFAHRHTWDIYGYGYYMCLYIWWKHLTPFFPLPNLLPNAICSKTCSKVLELLDCKLSKFLPKHLG